jgi:nucleoside 2-deoxyribosyltransferase
MSTQPCGCDPEGGHRCAQHERRSHLVVYIAGPFRGASDWARHQHIERAQALAFEVWAAGCVALCPHNNTRHFDGALPHQIWLAGDLELLHRCDAVLLVEGWEHSMGARAERDQAAAWGIPVFETLADLLSEY